MRQDEFLVCVWGVVVSGVGELDGPDVTLPTHAVSRQLSLGVSDMKLFYFGPSMKREYRVDILQLLQYLEKNCEKEIFSTFRISLARP